MGSLAAPSRRLGGQDDVGTRLRVRSGFVMTQRDAEPPADIRQRRRVDSPLFPRQLHRADERLPGSLDTIGGATGVKDASVERRVVSSDELRALKPRTESRPEFTEGGSMANVLPSESVNPGESELLRRRPNQKRPRHLDLALAAHDETHRTRTVPAVIGGLEIDGDESAHAVTIRFGGLSSNGRRHGRGQLSHLHVTNSLPHALSFFPFFSFPVPLCYDSPSDLAGGDQVRSERRVHAGAGRAGLGGS